MEQVKIKLKSSPLPTILAKNPQAIKKTTRGKSTIGQKENKPAVQGELDFNVSDIERALKSKIVKKCGNRMHWQE